MNCRHATRLLSEAQERQLSRRERFGLSFHVMICGACRRFQKQLRLLRQLLSQASPKTLAAVYASDVRLSDSRRQNIKTLLREASHAE
ncbi:MAG: hypothetical protein KDA57_11620 [Planctomycetales bacterium]|nr:hypothetical protein [Planctomycetales bacterium]